MTLSIDKLKPTRGRLIGEILNEEYVTDSGIIVSGVKKSKPTIVKIVSVGGPFENSKGEKQVYRAVVGQIAYFKLAEGKKFTVNQKEYLLLENDDIVGVEE